METQETFPEKPSELVNLRRRVIKQRAELRRFNKERQAREEGFYVGYNYRTHIKAYYNLKAVLGGNLLTGIEKGEITKLPDSIEVSVPVPTKLGCISKFFFGLGL